MHGLTALGNGKLRRVGLFFRGLGVTRSGRNRRLEAGKRALFHKNGTMPGPVRCGNNKLVSFAVKIALPP